MAKQHTKPCRECPWRRKSAPGYLGASNPVEFLQASESGQHMPCHMTVNYEDEDWQEKYESAPQCAGRAIHFANRCKSTYGTKVMNAPRDEETIFTWPQEFIDHHGRGKLGKVQIFGSYVSVEPSPKD